jgi:hypothetical protein
MTVNFLEHSYIHSCIITRNSQDQRLDYTAGSREFTPGETIQGNTSKATGKIKTVVLSGGSWGAGTAEGYLILSFVSGTFQAETITEITPEQDPEEDPIEYGTATAAGPATLETDEFGQAIVTSNSVTSLCLFDTISQSGPGGYVSGPSNSGQFFSDPNMVYLPAGTDIKRRDVITSLEPEFGQNYRVKSVKRIQELFTTTVDHIEAFIESTEKEQDTDIVS